jgi:hypothetical protein
MRMKHSDPRTEEGRKKIAEDMTEGAMNAWKRASEIAAEHGPTVKKEAEIAAEHVKKTALQTAQRAQAAAIEHAPKAKVIAGNLATKTWDSAKNVTEMCGPAAKEVASRASIASVRMAMEKFGDVRNAGSRFAWRVVFGIFACVFLYGFGSSLPSAIALYLKGDGDESAGTTITTQMDKKEGGISSMWASVNSMWPNGSSVDEKNEVEQKKVHERECQERREREKKKERLQRQEQELTQEGRSWYGFLTGQPEPKQEPNGLWEQAKQLIGVEPEKPKSWWEQLLGGTNRKE